MTPPILATYCPRTEDAGPALFAAAVARGVGAPLTIVAVHPSSIVSDDVYPGVGLADLPRQLAERALGDVRARVELDEPVELLAVEASSPARGITAAIEKAHPLLAVVGSTNRGAIGRVLPGSTAERVVHGAGCPIAVVPHGYQAPIAGIWTIGAAFVPTADGREALRTAAALARATGARLRAITAVNPHLANGSTSRMLAREDHEVGAAHDTGEKMIREAKETMRDALDELRDAPESEADVLLQDAADGLVAASAHLELLVIGSRAYGPLHAVMIGGVSRRVLDHAACPVLVLPRGAERAADLLLQAIAGPAAAE